jgi:hypothetical protein
MLLRRRRIKVISGLASQPGKWSALEIIIKLSKAAILVDSFFVRQTNVFLPTFPFNMHL